MGISGAVEWWEHWQLRILVLASLFVQWLLFLSAGFRKYAIPSWFRSIIWLAYLGSDALAIYALATLFSRESRQDCKSRQGNSILEVVWAPVLLMHLGGQDLITAYNIEDNELWTRHVLTAVSQITVAIYVFCKSWPPGGDKRLLQSAILFFVPGVLKCIEKPWALKSASISSLVSPSNPVPVRTANREGGISSLEDYVKAARAFVQVNPRRQAQELDAVDSHLPDQAQGENGAADLEANNRLPNQAQEEYDVMDLEAYKLFVDLASPFPDRLGILKSFWVLDEKKAYGVLQDRLFSTFGLLYTKEKMLGAFLVQGDDPSLLEQFSGYVRITAAVLPLAAIGLFHKSHRDAYDDNDVKVTYVLFCCTAVLEYSSWGVSAVRAKEKAVQRQWVQKILALYEQAKEKVMQWQWVKKIVARQERAETKVTQRRQTIQYDEELVRRITGKLINPRVGQYTLVGLFVRNKRHTKTTCILSAFNHKNFFYQHWSMKPCNSSSAIIELVHKYVKKGWEDQIKDADSYYKFNDRRGQWTLQSNWCDQGIICSLRRPFDESVLLWHVATDFCFYYMDASAECKCATAQCIKDASGVGHGCAVWCESSPRHKSAVRCREISDYMIYLLFIKPEMLLSGTRRNLLMTANAELEKILSDDNLLLQNILKGDKPSLMEILKGNKPFRKFFTGKRPSLKEIERGFIQRIITKVQHTENSEQAVEHTGSPPDAERYASTREGFVPDAWNLANKLLDIGDEKKMWEVIEGVWVEMLCFSASRCRGYLHAKSLGTGGELLTYVLLLLSQMGMETLPERLQRTELSSGEGNDQIHGMEHPTCFRRSKTQ